MTDQPPQPAGSPPGPALPPAAPPPAGWGAPPPGVMPPPRQRGPHSTSGRTSLAVAVIIVGVLFGANIVDAALPLPEDPALVDPGPRMPVEPGIPLEPGATLEPRPTGAPQPGETNTPIRTLPPLESQAPLDTPQPVEPGPVEPGQEIDLGSGFTIFPPSGWTSVGEEGGAVLQKNGVLVIAAAVPWDQSPTDLAAAYRDAWFAGGQFTGDDPQAGTMGNGIPAAGLSFTGVWNGAQVDGAIICGAIDGAGLIVNIVGPTGSLDAVSDDLDTILSTVQHAGG